MTDRNDSTPPPMAFRAGWRAALSGLSREACPYPSDDPLYRDAWHEGYSDAERERTKDVADVREAVKTLPRSEDWIR